MKNVWNSSLYEKLLMEAKKRRTLFEKGDVKTYTDIYACIAVETNLGISTVKNWKCRSSGGPGRQSDYVKLGEIFGVDPGAFLIEESELGEQSEEVTNNKEKVEDVYMTEFCKKNVFECYKLMKEFLTSMDIEDEDKYAELLSSIKTYEIAVPKDVFGKIYDFANVVLGEEIDRIYQENEDSLQAIALDEVESIKVLGEFFEKIWKMDQKLEKFGREELMPVLIGE